MLERTGVIVARFQVPELHAGHRYLIDYVLRRHRCVLIVLGESRTRPTEINPLPYELRAAMIALSYPGLRVVPLKDFRLDTQWSEELDNLIERHCGKSAVLYGSRDSFIKRYHGAFPTVAVAGRGKENGSDIRRRSLRGSVNPEFRQGIIYSVCSRPPAVYQAVDIAVYDRCRLLLAGKKEDGGKMRFIGGHVDASDTSLEMAAARECAEETGSIGVHQMEYLGSVLVDDWRYRGTPDRIMTALFQTQFMHGGPRPGDDIDSLGWIPFKEIRSHLIEEHLPLADLFLNNKT